MISHDDALDLAAIAIDFGISPSERGALETHLAGCSACRLEVAALQRDAARLRALPDIPPPAWVARAIGRTRRPAAALLMAAALVIGGTIAAATIVGGVLERTAELRPTDVAPKPTSSSVAPPFESASPAPTTDQRPAPTGRIAFLRTSVSDAGGDERLDAFVVDATGENLVRLTDDEKLEVALYWLADGSRIVIVWEESGNPYQQFLASILPDGSDRQELGGVNTVYGPAPLSPDGRYVAFGGDGDPAGATGVRLLDLATGTRIVLTDDGATNPIWSPDGSRLMVSLAGRRIGIIDVASGDQIAVIGSDVDRLLGWTSDGRSVLFNACTAGMTKPECMAAPALIADAEGSQPEVYSERLPLVPLGIVSPDGAWIAEVADGCVYRVVRMSDARMLLLDTWTALAAACASPSAAVSWSPDSAWIAVASGSGGGESVISLRSPLGGTPLTLTEGPSDGSPAWLPSP